MNEAPERIWATCGEYWRNPTFTADKTVYIRADLSDALIREAMGAFENAMGHLDTPISRRKIGIDPNEEWLLDARATLAKLRAHLDGETE